MTPTNGYHFERDSFLNWHSVTDVPTDTVCSTVDKNYELQFMQNKSLPIRLQCQAYAHLLILWIKLRILIYPKQIVINRIAMPSIC